MLMLNSKMKKLIEPQREIKIKATIDLRIKLIWEM